MNHLLMKQVEKLIDGKNCHQGNTLLTRYYLSNRVLKILKDKKAENNKINDKIKQIKRCEIDLKNFIEKYSK